MPVLAAALAATLGPLASPASAAHTGLQKVTQSSDHNPNDPKSVTAQCPAGKRLVGTGAEITGGGGQVVLDDITPNAALTQVTVTGYEDHAPGNTNAGGSLSWRVTAYAICANPFSGLELRTASQPVAANPANSVSPKTATANCSAGKSLIGTGADITGGVGDVTLDEIVPGAASVSVTAYEGHSGTNANWRLRAYAICAFAPAGRQLVTSPISAFDSATFKSRTASCPVGKLATGAGAQINGGQGHVVLDDFRPSPSPANSVFAGAYEEDHNPIANWWIRSYVICVNS